MWEFLIDTNITAEVYQQGSIPCPSNVPRGSFSKPWPSPGLSEISSPPRYTGNQGQEGKYKPAPGAWVPDDVTIFDNQVFGGHNFVDDASKFRRNTCGSAERGFVVVGLRDFVARRHQIFRLMDLVIRF